MVIIRFMDEYDFDMDDLVQRVEKQIPPVHETTSVSRVEKVLVLTTCFVSGKVAHEFGKMLVRKGAAASRPPGQITRPHPVHFRYNNE